MSNTKNLWFICAKTNIHVGNENISSYGLIDKSVQRDVLTGLPNINGSSLKGALNEFFSVRSKEIGNKTDDEINKWLKDVFGVDKLAEKKGRDKETKKGLYTFFDAQLLSVPVQSDKRLFFRAFCPAVLRKLCEQAKLFNLNCPELIFDGVEPVDGSPVVFTPERDTKLNGIVAINKVKPDGVKQLETLLGESLAGEEIALFSENDFKELCDDNNLPIIARNKLEDGDSQNLWYEQVLPRETIFYSMFFSNGPDIVSEYLNGQVVQIGANATIGYGYCEFRKII